MIVVIEIIKRINNKQVNDNNDDSNTNADNDNSGK